MNNTAIVYEHFTLNQWKNIVFCIKQQLHSKDLSPEAKDLLLEILVLCPSEAL